MALSFHRVDYCLLVADSIVQLTLNSFSIFLYFLSTGPPEQTFAALRHNEEETMGHNTPSTEARQLGRRYKQQTPRGRDQ